MSSEKCFCITLNLAAQSLSLPLLSASLVSVLNQIDHSSELNPQLSTAIHTVFERIITLKDPKTIKSGIQTSLSYGDHRLRITFTYQGKALLNGQNNIDNFTVVYNLMDNVAHEQQEGINLLILDKWLRPHAAMPLH